MTIKVDCSMIAGWWNMDTYKNFRDVFIPQFKDIVQILFIE